MAKNILFLTGKLAEKSLHKTLEDITSPNASSSNSCVPSFKYRVQQMGVSVAALMTPQLIARRLSDVGDADKVIIPGLCQGDLTSLQAQLGIPVERGPNDLKDLPQFFGNKPKNADLSQYDVRIFAEIVDAPQLSVAAIVAKAEKFKAQGANVIDLGCLPNSPFGHMQESIQALKHAGLEVSVDSMQVDELLNAGKAGADYLLSLTEKTLWLTDEVASIPILISAKPGTLPSLFRAIDQLIAQNKPFIADAILDPIPFGFTNSLLRYQKLRRKYPDIQIMMGVGNLTELTDADTTGINALLFGLISEMKINAVLATSVSPHAINAIAEADIARRIMYAAREDIRLPRGYSKGLLGLHDRRPFSYSNDEIQNMASLIKDPSFRIQVNEAGVHVYNRDGLHTAIDPFVLYPNLGVENDASHAFYLGVELARAQIAWQLKKKYQQDEMLEWGVTEIKKDETQSHREASLNEKKSKLKNDQLKQS